MSDTHVVTRPVPDVLVVDPLDRGLEQFLSASGMRATRASSAELAARVHQTAQQPDVIVVDTRGGHGIPPLMAAVKRQHPAIGFVVVASESDPAMLLEAMRAGATEFLQEPVTAAALEQAILRLVAHRAAPSASGEVFAFVGAKGGVGTTTAAVNVATALAKIAPGQTLFADLHLASGDAAVLFGAEPRFSIADALENTHRFDEAFFRDLVTSTAAGVALLGSSDRDLAQHAGLQPFLAVVEFAAQLYRYVILDVPRSDAAAFDALAAATCIVVVTNQELPAVRGAGRLAATLRERYGRDKVLVVVNRVDKLADISQRDVEKAVAAKVRHMLPSDYRLALQALNTGRPLALDNHNKLAAGFRGLAHELAKFEPESRRSEPGGSLLGRLTRRG